MRDRQWVNRDPDKLGVEMPPRWSLERKTENYLMTLPLFTKPSPESKQKVLTL